MLAACAIVIAGATSASQPAAASLPASSDPLAAAAFERPGVASIPFANHGGIYNRRSDGTKGI